MLPELALALCSWNNPGANPTTAPIEQTVAMYGLQASAEMIRKIKAGEYDELVVVKKGDTRMRDMSFGKGRLCSGGVDTARWADDHVEHGRVFRVGSESLVWFWRCQNLARWLPAPNTRTFEGGPGPSGGPGGPFLPIPLVPLPYYPPVAGPAPLALPPVTTFEGGRAYPQMFTYQPVGGGYTYVPPPALPEPPTIIMVLVGVVAIALLKRN